MGIWNPQRRFPMKPGKAQLGMTWRNIQQFKVWFDDWEFILWSWVCWQFHRIYEIELSILIHVTFCMVASGNEEYGYQLFLFVKIKQIKHAANLKNGIWVVGAILRHFQCPTTAQSEESMWVCIDMQEQIAGVRGKFGCSSVDLFIHLQVQY